MSHFYHQIGATEWSVEVEGVVIGYITARESANMRTVVYSVRKNKTDQWVGAYQNKREAAGVLEGME